MRSDAARITELVCQPWLIPAAVHRELAAKFRSLCATGQTVEKTPAPLYRLENGAAIVPVHGVLWQGWSDELYDEWAGVTSTDVLARAVTAASLDPAADRIELHIDSPGGLSTGIPEAARAVMDARERKPILAYNAAMMDSAAYWLGAGATMIWATESARTGSIGAYLALLDLSGYYDEMGIKVELFKSGENKGMGIPGTSLTDEQRARLQTRIDKLGAKFRDAVSTARANGVQAEYMDGDDYDADEAAGARLIDGVGTLEQARAELARVLHQSGQEIKT